jgi:pyruvate,water dikinase
MMPGLDRVRRANYSKQSDQALLKEFEAVRGDVLHRYTIHGKINFALISAGWFSDFYIETFHPDDPTEPYVLLQGYPTRSLGAGRGIWRLSRIVKADPSLRKTFDSVDVKVLVQALKESPKGRAFLQELETYLDEFGWRSDAFELAHPSWWEEPTIPLNTIQGYVLLDEDANPETRYRQAIATREQLLARARKQLTTAPEKLERFNRLHEMARHYLTITENHNFYIDQIGLATVRKVARELGRRLQKLGTLGAVDDVFMLRFAEIEDAMAGKDFRGVARERREELARWTRVTPVDPIGEPPPQEGTPDPLIAAIGKMFELPFFEPDRDPNIVRGTAASKGIVQGRAKVVRSLTEASKLRKGDVMICEMTMPAWTPLFSTVSALVADTGGVLSHCAIVSREYGLPAVVGTKIGTSVIRDGMLVTVDGTKGIVRIDSRT